MKAIYNSYSISTLLFPSFFISAICNALLPEISYNHERNNKLQDFNFSFKVKLSMSSCNGVIIVISFALTPFLNNSSLTPFVYAGLFL